MLDHRARTPAIQQFRRGDVLNGEQIVGGVGDHDVALTIVLDDRQWPFSPEMVPKPWLDPLSDGVTAVPAPRCRWHPPPSLSAWSLRRRLPPPSTRSWPR